MAQLAEQNLNEIQMAGGYYSAKPISTTSTLAAGNTTITGTITASGAISGTSITSTGAVIQGVQTLAAAGAVDLVTSITRIDSAGAIALTLADGANGQMKSIVMGTDGGDATLTPTTKTGFSTIVFNDAGDGVTLVFITTKGWICTGNNGATIS